MSVREYLYVGSINEYLEDPESYNLGEDALSMTDIETLKCIKTGDDIVTMTTGRVWEDDHEACINMIVNGVKVSALWVVPEFLADIIYAGKGNADAKNEVAKYIKDVIEMS